MSLNSLVADLNNLKNPAKAKILARFFKTGPGEYGEGDQFLGVTVPLQRHLVKKHSDLTLPEVQTLLNSKIHEHRLTSLYILIHKYNKAEEPERKKIFNFYLKNAKYINNWDLVDTTAPNIVGDFLANHGGDVKLLYHLAQSKNLWKKRIAILSTFTFIRQKNFVHTIKIAKILIADEHDLMHKAVGWMLREVGKRDRAVLENFLEKYSGKMPRTMLRYAIEKFSFAERKNYLK